MSEEKKKENFILVSVITTSGFYPEEGYKKVPKNQKVRIHLERASKELGLTDTSDWVAVTGGETIDINLSYEENDLDEQIDVDYGPKEGGGGIYA